MVRLKLNGQEELLYLTDVSQFHYGSIKTKEKIKKGYSLSTRLNSTMVRLKR